MKPCKFFSATFLFFATLTFLFSSHSGVYAQDIRPYDEGPIHEAFVAPESGSIILDAVALEPPRPITERIPAMDDPEAEWIPGYWAWQPQLQDFVWVSGVWRKPPPGHQWILGYWENFDEGWVWLRGFWSPVPLSQLTDIDIAPPDLIDENVAQAPGSNYFWMPGYWEFSPSDRQYLWVSGQWELFDPQWVFVPAHYVWRPDGYIFISAYWDWPMETRGTVYSCVFIQPAVRAHIVYLPAVIIEYPVIIHNLFPYYPDYICFFGHFHHHHPGFWQDFCCVPPWWGWEAWWSFSWHDHWGLWWWWCHPGFPQPLWLSAQFSSMLPPPGQDLLAMMANIKGPGIITPNGVVKPGDLRDGLADVTGGKPDLLRPILPSKPQELDDVIDAVKPDIPDRILKPTGRRTPDPRRQVLKPTIPSTVPEGAVRIRPSVPSKPRIPTTRPPIRRPIRPPATYPPPRETAPPSYVPQRPPRRSYRPPERRQRPPRVREIPPSYEPRYPPRQRRPESRPPWYPQPEPRQEPPTEGRTPRYPQPGHRQEPPTETRPPSYVPPLRMPESFRPMVPPFEPTPPPRTAPPSEIDTPPMQTAPPPRMTNPRIDMRQQEPREFRMREYQPQSREIEQQPRQEIE